MTRKITRYNLAKYLQEVGDLFIDAAGYFEEKEDDLGNESLAYAPDCLEIISDYMNGELELIE